MSFNVKVLQEYTNSYYTDEYLTYMLIYMLYDNDFDYYHPLYISVIVHEFNKYCLSDEFQYFPKSSLQLFTVSSIFFAFFHIFLSFL